MTPCYYHVTYAFHSESTLHSCLNVKVFLARNRHHIWSLGDSNEVWNHSHLVCKWNDWAVLWVHICTVHLTVCYYHVTDDFQSESTLISCSSKAYIIWPVGLNFWLFIYKLIVCGFESRCCHLFINVWIFF